MHNLKNWSLVTGTAMMLAACGGGESGLVSVPAAVTRALQNTASTAVDATFCTTDALAVGAYQWVGDQCTLASALISNPLVTKSQSSALVSRAATSATSTNITATPSATLDTTALFDWAEANFPTLFPGHKTNLSNTVFVYRYYPETQSAVGVSEGKVYGVGPVTGNQLVLLGNVSDFTCRVSPSLCTAPVTTVPDTTTAGTSGTTSTAGVQCNYSYSALNTTASVNKTSTANWICNSTSRVLSANGLPDHATGTFPNANNPNAITAQTVAATYTLTPAVVSATGTAATIVGYGLNGVKFDPATGGSCNDSGSSCSMVGGTGTWRIEALTQTSFNFGVDANNAHVQPTGEYHYHGMPEGLIAKQGKGTGMTLIGWAADGFPIYARYGFTKATDANSGTTVLKGSYKTKTTADANRPAASLYPLGTFIQDWEYVAGSGDLDECNGRTGVTPEFPNGIYHYYATDTYPFFQRCVKGTPAAAAAGSGGTGPGAGGGSPPPPRG